ncbi:MAG TPA: tetratricopeptide repeat protein [Thermoanaerobaculia bacterium]|nr:tetratricopeptide repeat protein [Thermoanaerobaculia bacterium]
MATYLGNSSLSQAVKDRVVSTFQQTLALYKQGRHDEVIQGCSLILRMDPQFDPAKKLLEKTRNPASPVDVDSLMPTTNDPMSEAREAMAARDFQRVINITTEVLTDDLLNDDARVLNEQAREKMEAAPFVEQFVRKFDQVLGAGNVAGARAELEKARSLDADHPAIAKMEAALPSAAPAPPPAAFSFDSPSFVVETPAPPSSRGTAQASDFGFTFEEEKPPEPPPAAAPTSFSFDDGFSFDTPAASDPFASFKPSVPAPPPAPDEGPSTFDFDSASVETTDDDQKKIAQYLADGDRAFDGGDYQKAIDLWSRIFLIDVTNDEASQRIEKAKAKRREIEQRIEGVVAAAMAAYDKRDYEAARAKFNEVLRLDPANETATEYLERLASAPTAASPAAAAPPPPPPSPKIDIFADDDFGVGEAPLMPPEPIAAPAPAKTSGKEKAVRPATGAKRSMMPVIVVVLLVAILGGGGWYVWQKFFNAPAETSAASEATLNQAESLAKRGKYDQAIAMLKDVKPDDPLHDRALVMIADLQKRRSQASEMVDGRPAAVVYQESLAAGQQAFAGHDYDAAKKAFDTAARIKPLPPDVAPLYDQASQQVGKLDAAKSLFKEQKYGDAIANLQPLLAADPQNRSIQRLITDAHFNLGAQALQDEHGNRTGDAIKEFDEVLKANPSDELAKRSRQLAERYNGQPKDLLYKIYVKYLPLRNVS